MTTTPTTATPTPAERAALDRYMTLVTMHRYPPALAVALATQHAADYQARIIARALGQVKRQLDADKLPKSHPYRQAVAMIEGALGVDG